MRNSFFGILFALLFSFVQAQTADPDVCGKWNAQGQIFLERYAQMPQTVSKSGANPARTYLEENYGLRRISSLRAAKSKIDYIPVFLSYNNEEALEKAASYGFRVHTRQNGICTGLFPLNAVREIESIDGITRIECSRKMRVQNNVSRIKSAVNKVQEDSALLCLNASYNGQGVIIGIIDVGFDFTHPAFYSDPSRPETYRVVKVWDQNEDDETYMPAPPYDAGAEYTSRDQILQIGQDVFSYLRTDVDLTQRHHGTHVAATAAGAGAGTPYAGMAPAAELVLVSTSLLPPNIIEGVQYIKDYAKSVAKPCVVNISVGSDIGPHDGSTAEDTMLNYLVEPGFLVVGSAGNTGGDSIHIGGTVTPSQPCNSVIRADLNNTSIALDVYDLEKGLKAVFYLVNAVTGKAVDSAVYTMANAFSKTQYIRYRANKVLKFYGWTDAYKGRNKARLYIEIESDAVNPVPDNCYLTVSFKSTGANSTRFNAWIEGASFAQGDAEYTHNAILSTADSVLSVAAYVSRQTWTMGGNSYSYIGVGVENDICNFSGKGPRTDGVQKPDIAAPGSAIFSAANSFLSIPDNTGVGVTHMGNKAYNWMAMMGTSMATPAVSGIVALMLQHTPDLSFSQLKQLLDSTAVKDDFVNAAGSALFGRGKIDAGAMLSRLEGITDCTPPAANPDSPVIDPPVIEPEKAAVDAPQFVGWKESYTDSARVELKCDTSGAEIYYKVNAVSTYALYTGPFYIYNTAMVYAYARKEGLETSRTVHRTYTVKKTPPPEPPVPPRKDTVDAPQFVGWKESYTDSARVELKCDTAGASVYYKVDAGSQYALYTKPFYLNTTATVYAYAAKSGLENSRTVSRTYTVVISGQPPVIDPPVIDPPVVDPDPHKDTVDVPQFVGWKESYTDSARVELKCDTAGASVYYKLNDGLPYALYTKPFYIDSTATVYAYGTKSGLENSRTASKLYTVVKSEQPPVIDPPDPPVVDPDTQPVPHVTPKYTVELKQTSGGMIDAWHKGKSVQSGQAFDSGSVILFFAVPSHGYEFVSWWNGTDKPQLEYVLQQNVTAFAAFRPKSTDPVSNGDVAETLRVKVSPNPSHGVFNVEVPVAVRSCVMAENGQIIQSFVWNKKGTYRIDLSGHNAGMYYLRLEGRDLSRTVKLLLK